MTSTNKQVLAVTVFILVFGMLAILGVSVHHPWVYYGLILIVGIPWLAWGLVKLVRDTRRTKV